DEREYDRQQARRDRDFETFKDEAIESVLEDLMEGKEPYGCTNLQGELEEMGMDLVEAVRAILIRRATWADFVTIMENRLRREIEDTTTVEERAADLAQGYQDGQREIAQGEGE